MPTGTPIAIGFYPASASPVDERYLNETVAYVSEAAVLAAIPIGKRHDGLTVRIGTKDYNFLADLTTLVEKRNTIQRAVDVPIDDTGALFNATEVEAALAEVKTIANANAIAIAALGTAKYNPYQINMPAGNITTKIAGATFLPVGWATIAQSGDYDAIITHALTGRKISFVNVFEIDGSDESLLSFDKGTAYTGIKGNTGTSNIATPVNSAFTNAIGALADGTYYYRVSAVNPVGETLASSETSLAIAKLATPVNAAFTAGAGTLAIGTYYYRVSAINAVGETLASSETSLALGAIGGVNVNWGAVTGATGYKIYGRTTGAELLIATVGAVLTYLDNGSVTPSGALPASNTTAGGINVNWGTVIGATGYKIYGRTAGAELYIAAVGAVTTYLDNGSITPSGALPAIGTVLISGLAPTTLPIRIELIFD